MKAQEKKRLGLYLHIPFCRSKCLYCDFCSKVGQSDARMRAYADALCRDLDRYADQLNDYTVDTVYFGGGTPTLMPVSRLVSVLDTIAKRYSLSSDAEITAECNPTTADRVSLSSLRHAGVNRLSIGVQSIHDLELRAIGRRQSYTDVLTLWEDAQAVGFSNLSADVMTGLPRQSVQSYLQTLEAVTQLSPTHLSAYGLTLEEGTPLCRLVAEGKVSLPSEEETEKMYFEGIRYLESKGFRQYEISNFAKEGYESRHNLKYWNCEEYLGIGVSAHSDLFGERFGNSREIDAYIEGRDVKESSECPDACERMNEYVMLRLRLCEGIDKEAFCSRFDQSDYRMLEEKIKPYVRMGYALTTPQRIALTEKGFYVSNAILSDLVEFRE